ncbi:helix-turn-helix DNA binding domain protein [Gordonia phage Cashline]|nr:helix-turn-helix DNA binding domain protein [Gordonia phage Cashline]
MRAHTQTRRELNAAQRQVRVGVLAANGLTVGAIARELEVPAETVLDDLEAMEMIPPRPSGRPTSACGTPSAYYRHRRNGDEACQPCKAAVSRHQTEMRQRRAERAEGIAS